jgi:GAF domain-containing protein
MTRTTQQAAPVASSAVPAPRTAEHDDLALREAVVSAVAASVDRPIPVRGALQAALDGVCSAVGFPAGHAYVYDNVLGELVSSPLWYVSNPFRFSALVRLTAATPVTSGAGLPARVFATAETIQLSAIQDDPGFRRSRVALTAGLRAAIGCPVMVHGRAVAVLEFFAPRELPDDPELVAFLEGVADAVASVFSHAAAADTA